MLILGLSLLTQAFSRLEKVLEGGASNEERLDPRIVRGNATQTRNARGVWRRYHQPDAIIVDPRLYLPRRHIGRPAFFREEDDSLAE